MVTHYQFCDVCETPLDDGKGFVNRSRCETCESHLESVGKTAKRLIELLLGRIKKLEDRTDPYVGE